MPNLTGNQRQIDQIMEPDAHGRLGNSPKSDSGYTHLAEKSDEKGLSKCTPSFPEISTQFFEFPSIF